MDLKDLVEDTVVDFLKKCYQFNFELLFYDVTTLYFETFKADELRIPGFSKNNKSLQAQIVVALMVTPDGFPVGFEVFLGNTFEGNTIIPVVESFIKKRDIQKFTIVADAAMISNANIESFLAHNINYIVGARLGNITQDLFEQIQDNLKKEDGQTTRIRTDKGDLICSYSKVRYNKDKYEMEKQIKRAEFLKENPSKNKKVKFLKLENKKPVINTKLIERTTALLGVKGYYTNLSEKEADNATIIARYHDLYKIEQAFRIAKSDLQTRPIFHYKEQPIKLHLLICFMALVTAKHIELRTEVSIKKFLTELKKITDARLYSHLTKKEMKMRVKTNPRIEALIDKLKLPH